MRLVDYISEDQVKIGLEANNKEEVIEELSELLAESCECNADQIFSEVMKREREGSTGLEMGVAIPHAKCDAVRKLSIVVGISGEGIDFESQDEKPSHLFFMMVAPKSESGPHVQAIAKIVKMIKIKEFRKKLLKAKTPSEVIQALGATENGEG